MLLFFQSHQVYTIDVNLGFETLFLSFLIRPLSLENISSCFYRVPQVGFASTSVASKCRALFYNQLFFQWFETLR